jgi:hypothetical protein
LRLQRKKNARKIRYKGLPEEKAKAAQENGFDGDDDCVAFKEILSCIAGCYKDLDYRTARLPTALLPSNHRRQYIVHRPQVFTLAAAVQAIGV